MPLPACTPVFPCASGLCAGLTAHWQKPASYNNPTESFRGACKCFHVFFFYSAASPLRERESVWLMCPVCWTGPIFIDRDCRAFFKSEEPKPEDGPIWRHVLRVAAQVCVSVTSLFISACAVSHCMDKKSLNQWVKYGVSKAHSLARTHTSHDAHTLSSTHTLTHILRVCESELSVLLSHTIHH